VRMYVQLRCNLYAAATAAATAVASCDHCACGTGLLHNVQLVAHF
jgi:hypothetical protein